MVDILRILCAVDFSDASRRALEYAVALARWYGGRVTVFHVFTPNPPLVADSAFGGHATFPPQVTAEDALADVRRFCDPLGPEGPLEFVVRQGSAVPGIVEQAQQMAADLLVIGTHGRSGFERLFLGSAAERVLRKVRCPVLTVPPPVDEAIVGRVTLKTILCPLDFSPPSTRALEYALSLAKEADARLVMLHVLESYVEPAHMGEMAHFTVPEYDRYMKASATGRLKALVPADARVWCTPEELVTTGRAHREILRVASEAGADLIVMGVHGRGTVDLMLFGSTTNEVIRSARTPVLTLRS
jgi:nucleotide-binding universal stress UspA family protein